MDTKLESSAAVLDAHKDADGNFPTDKKITVVFVLGGPGSGKGTQCAKIVEHFGFTHLSTGDLLRAESKSGSPNGIMIRDMMNEGKIVPSEVTIKLLQKAMLESGNDKFLIDGFPRNDENRAAFENIMKIEPEFVLYFHCPVEELERRLLNRNQGRDDDNIETIQKRFKVFTESTLPILEYYDSKGKLREVDAGKPVDEVFEDVKAVFSTFAVKADTCSKSNVSMVLRLESLIHLVKRLFRAARMLLTRLFQGTAPEEGPHASLIQK